MYYLRRPRRLLILFAFFVCSTYFLWDRHNLVVHQEETVKSLTQQNDKLQQKLEKLADLLTERGESLPNELEFQEQENSGSKGSGQDLPDKTKKPTLTDVDEDPVAAQRCDKVKEAMLHAWTAYEKYAWGIMDELKVYIRSRYVSQI